MDLLYLGQSANDENQGGTNELRIPSPNSVFVLAHTISVFKNVLYLSVLVCLLFLAAWPEL